MIKILGTDRRGH